MIGIVKQNRQGIAVDVGWTCWAVVMSFAASVSGQEVTPTSPVLAKVGDAVVRRQAIEDEIPVKDWRKGLTQPQIREIESAALDRVIERHVVFDYLKVHDQLVGQGELQVQKEALIAELAKYEKSLSDYLKEKRISESELDFRFVWRESWNRYLAGKLTESNLELHFNNHRRKFDGTKLRVAHVLIKAGSPAKLTEALEAARGIKAKLDTGELAWDQAVSKHSQGSQEDAGEVGVIARVGVMPPAFAEAAFLLEQGQISPPVTTTVGVHLIKCLEVIPGNRGWRDARKAVEKDASLFLFNVIVKRHRDKVKVTTYDWPD